MSKTRKDFCRNLLDDDSIPLDSLDPERLAARFVRYFKLSGRPTLDELSVMLSRAGFGEVSDREMDGLKGAHIGKPRGHYAIYYRQGLWDGSSRLYRAPRDLRDHQRDPLGHPLRRHAGPQGVPGGRPLRGGGADATGSLRVDGRGVGLRRAGLAEAVPAAPTPR